MRIGLLLGGAFGLARYIGRWRNTKDLDFFIMREQRDALVDVLNNEGFCDYYDEAPYDRSWIYRGIREGVVVDLIWTLPNHRTRVDATWFEHAVGLPMRGRTFQAVPAEELLWIKLYVLQRDRCDWPDLLNLLSAVSGELDWNRLIRRLGSDLPLLHSLLVLYNWLCPVRARSLPASLRERFQLPELPEDLGAPEVERAQLLDGRPWYAVLQPTDRAMQI